MDNHGIDARHINSGFDNRGREQQIGFAVGKFVHDVFKLFDRHLAVSHQNFDIRHQSAQFFFNPVDIRNPRADEESLAVTEFFAVNRFFYHNLIKRHDKSSGCQAVNRRRGDNAQLFDAGQRQLQRPRNRRGGQRQNMDIGFQLFEFFFMGNPEMLFFINNQQAEIGKSDVFGQQCVRADDNVDRAFSQATLNFFGFFRRYQTGKHFDLKRKVFHPL